MAHESNRIAVAFSTDFVEKYRKMPAEWKGKINFFVSYVVNHGFYGLEGRNKSSEDVPKNHPNFIEAVKHARLNSLWHYHIGIEKYDNGKHGDKTSKYVIHYKKNKNNSILVCSCSKHPPMVLPKTYQIKPINR